jgi:hypothetical protein
MSFMTRSKTRPKETLRPDEQQAEDFFTTLGLQVLRIPIAPPLKTPDFSIQGDARPYLLEVKAREDSADWTHSMNSGQVALQERSMGYGHWAANVASDAVEQFRSRDDQHLSWWVLWLAITCVAEPDEMTEEAISTLLGVRLVAYCDSNSEPAHSRKCLFARIGVFERHPEVVATVVVSDSGLWLCVNEFSKDFDSFQKSLLWSHFAASQPPMTATDLMTAGNYFRLDPSVDRQHDSAIQAYLETTYNLAKATMMDMKSHTATIVPGLWKPPAA